MLIWYLVGIVLLLIASCEYYALKTGVPTVTSFPSARKEMIKILREEIARLDNNKKESVIPHEAIGFTNREDAESRLVSVPQSKPFAILDLGSGTGKLALEIGRALPEAHVEGLELSWVPFLLSRIRGQLWRLFGAGKNVAFRREDFWQADISGVDAVVLFMNGNIHERMAEKLQKELKPNALVISNETHLPDWTPIETRRVGLLKLAVVVYRKS